MNSEKQRPLKMLVICPHPEGVAPGQRLKYEQYFESFRRAGIQVDISPFMNQQLQDIVYRRGHFGEKIFWTIVGYFRRVLDIFRLRNYDVVYVFLWVTPFGPPFFESIYSYLCKGLVYDIDDLAFMAPASRANGLIARFKGTRKMSFLMEKAHEVIVCTPSLEEIVRKHNSHVTDISSTINTETYIPVNSYTNEQPLTLGWSGSHSTSKYLLLLEPVLKRLRERYDFKILVMGDTEFRFRELDCECVAWSEQAEVPTLQRIDIGLYPLPLGDPWVFGKSGLKALQYMALGIPTVATALGANFRVIEDGVTGFLVTTDDEWVDILSKLIEDAQTRRRVGLAASQSVKSKFSIAANKDTYISIIRRAADTSGFVAI